MMLTLLAAAADAATSAPASMSWMMLTIFAVVIIAMLALDLGVFHRKAHVVGFREAIIWTIVWIVLALIFGGFIGYRYGQTKMMEYMAGYVIEKSLSVDNIFVFLVLFSYFKVPEEQKHRVLFYGIMGAIIMRAILIYLGAALVKEFSWVLYIFGLILIYTGVKLAFKKDEEVDPEHNPVLKLTRRMFPMTETYEGKHFFVRRNGVLFATPLFAVVMMVESTDLVFALDSIPAIFAVSKDPMILFTSNIFAIMGLRALFFAVQGLMGLFRFLPIALSFILVFVGCKMLLPLATPLVPMLGFAEPEHPLHMPISWSLTIILSTLALSIIASLMYPPKNKAEEAHLVEVKDEKPNGG